MALNKTGSGFTNLQKVIGANQNNQLGSTIQQGIGNQVNQVKAGVNNAQNQFNTQLNQNNTALDANQQKVNGILSSPTTASDQDVKTFQDFQKGSYSGPQNLQDVDTLRNQATNTQQLGQQIGSSGGRLGLLQRFVGGNQYTQGQQRLDNLLLGQTGANELKQSRRDASGLNQQVNTADTLAQAKSEEAKQKALFYGNQANQQLQTARTGLSQNIDQQLQSKVNNIQPFRDYLKNNGATVDPGPGPVDPNDPTGGKGYTPPPDSSQAAKNKQAMIMARDKGFITNDQLQSFLTSTPKLPGQITMDTAKEQQDNIRQALLQGLISTGDASLTRQGVASQQQIAQENALSRLAGQNAEFNPNTQIAQKPVLDLTQLNSLLDPASTSKSGPTIGLNSSEQVPGGKGLTPAQAAAVRSQQEAIAKAKAEADAKAAEEARKNQLNTPITPGYRHSGF